MRIRNGRYLINRQGVSGKTYEIMAAGLLDLDTNTVEVEFVYDDMNHITDLRELEVDADSLFKTVTEWDTGYDTLTGATAVVVGTLALTDDETTAIVNYERNTTPELRYRGRRDGIRI